MKIPITIQMQPGENGAAALCMILGYYKRYVPMEEMRDKCVSSRNGSSPEQLIAAGEAYGLKGEKVKLSMEELTKEKFPLIVQWKKRYYCIVKSIQKDTVTVVDPSRGEYKLGLKKFESYYKGEAIQFTKSPEFKTGGKRESLLSLLKDRILLVKTTMFGLLILSLLFIFLDLRLSVVQKDFLDEIVGRTDYSSEKEMIGLATLYGLMILTTVLSIMKTGLVFRTARNSAASSGSKLFKKMFSQPLKFFEQYSAGELMSRIDNNVRLDNSIIQALVPRFIDAFMTIFYLVMLLKYNYVIALVCVAIEIINIGVTIYFQEKNAIASRSMATSNGALSTSVLNGLNMIDTIKSCGAERSFYNMWYSSQSQALENRLTGNQINAVITFTNNVHNYLLQAVQLFLGAYFVVHGNFTLGTMSLFQTVLTKMRTSMGNCLTTVNTLQTMRTNIERVNDINKRDTGREIPIPAEDYEKVDKLDGSISVKNVYYRYNSGDEPVVNDVSMEVKRGQIVAIVGETGCGKSTLLKIMADLYTAESGEILYSGKKREEIPDMVFCSSVTTVDQETMIFEDSVYANIKMWDNTIEDYEVIMAARDAQIHDRIMRDRDGYGSYMLENGKNFSGGELQRLELARALSHEPTLLFLDEFTSALDALTEDRVIKSIRDKGTTCVIVAHRLSTIVDCDRIYVMDKGRVVEEGTHDELYKLGGLYKKLVGGKDKEAEA